MVFRGSIDSYVVCSTIGVPSTKHLFDDPPHYLATHSLTIASLLHWQERDAHLYPFGYHRSVSFHDKALSCNAKENPERGRGTDLLSVVNPVVGMWEASSPGVYEAGVGLLTVGLAVACWLFVRGGRDRSTSRLAGIRSLQEFRQEEVLKDEVGERSCPKVHSNSLPPYLPPSRYMFDKPNTITFGMAYPCRMIVRRSPLVCAAVLLLRCPATNDVMDEGRKHGSV